MEEFVIWYNTKRPHMSLNWDELETPVQAFNKKRELQQFVYLYCLEHSIKEMSKLLSKVKGQTNSSIVGYAT